MVMLLPVVMASVALFETLHVPPVSVVPESCVTLPFKLNVPLLTFTLPVLLKLPVKVEVPPPAVFVTVP